MTNAGKRRVFWKAAEIDDDAHEKRASHASVTYQRWSPGECYALVLNI